MKQSFKILISFKTKEVTHIKQTRVSTHDELNLNKINKKKMNANITAILTKDFYIKRILQSLKERSEIFTLPTQSNPNSKSLITRTHVRQ